MAAEEESDIFTRSFPLNVTGKSQPRNRQFAVKISAGQMVLHCFVHNRLLVQVLRRLMY